MTDYFTVLPLRKLLRISLNAINEKDNYLGLRKELFFSSKPGDAFRMKRFGQMLESPLGVAAGPHTQLSQNIVGAWLAGARFMELKTVQTLDEIEVSKPCIDMQDEGYNCEWSQELKLQESFEQYLDAWIVLHILRDALGYDIAAGSGFIFNMSVGYDLKGIMNDNVQWFLDKMTNAEPELQKKIEEIKDIYPRVSDLIIPSQISDNVTLSTMHGCPPHEIRQIADYLITEHALHTAVKLNPTLLGKDDLHNILADSGFETHVPDQAFEHDLKYPDALEIIRYLQKAAKKKGVEFGLKLTNTLESQNNKDVFGEKIDMMYGSGKMLHPISVNTARKLQNEFKGTLDISFSGGADAFNTADLLKSGLMPVTVSSDLLKPGGYGRLAQYIENISNENWKPEFWNPKVNTEEKLAYLNQYADQVLIDKKYKRSGFSAPSIKTETPLGIFDCAFAPCETTCPTNQDIPSYMYHTARGEFDKAFEVIKRTNPFPNTTGMVCDHLCETKCTRINYDSPLKIREIKRFVTESQNPSELNSEFCAADAHREAKDKKVAVIGAGPAGLSFAYFMNKAGFETVVYEQKERAGGMPASVIPKFRLTDEAIDIDIASIADEGVKIKYGQTLDALDFKKIREDNDYVFIGVGARKARFLSILGANAQTVTDPLVFLEKVKSDPNYSAGKQIAVIGGGNTAMDAARTAKRLVGDKGEVHILYRRTKDQMPADVDEILDAIKEGVKLTELVSPVKIEKAEKNQKALFLRKMRLGEKGGDGRRRPVPIPDSEFSMTFDTIIPAVGQDLDIDFADAKDLESSPGSYQTKLPNVFIGGDAMRGASSLIKAVGDGRKAAQIIIDREDKDFDTRNKQAREAQPIDELILKKAKRMPAENASETQFKGLNFELLEESMSEEAAQKEARRCLLCDELCNVCTTVCPNFALQAYAAKPTEYFLEKVENGKIITDKKIGITQNQQIIHIADWCNQCGNCNTFCPTKEAPYKVKPHLYLDSSEFEKADTGYYYDVQTETLHSKIGGFEYQMSENETGLSFLSDDTKVEFEKDTFRIKEYTGVQNAVFEKALEMKHILSAAKEISIS
jgi:putative selenate reductase